MIRTIRLPGGEYQYDDAARLGRPGGFGDVFRGRRGEEEIAIKRLRLDAGHAAHRELSIARQFAGGNFEHVVPFLDAGQDAETDQYFIAMPLCEGSLQDAIGPQGMVIEDALVALRSIVAGLLEVSDLTHRDLKPDNVLLHEGRWKIADFGIAKFVEDATSHLTLRNFHTPPYAAPEQWRGEAPSHATDVYALGCIAHALMGGKPPFCGSYEEIKSGHLFRVPPNLDNCPDELAAFVGQMLRKPPAGRPTLLRCQNMLSRSFNAQQPEPLAVIADAARFVGERIASADAARAARLARAKQRQEQFDEATDELMSIFGRLTNKFTAATDAAKMIHPGRMSFGGAVFALADEFIPADDDYGGEDLKHARKAANWDLIGYTFIELKWPDLDGGQKLLSWSATLAFADRNDGNGFRWYELAFYRNMPAHTPGDAPFSLKANTPDFFLALFQTMHRYALAYGPFPIDAEDEHSFAARWASLISQAAKRLLKRPTAFPIQGL